MPSPRVGSQSPRRRSSALLELLGSPNPNTDKLDLPPISQGPTRGALDTQHYASHNLPRPVYAHERLPSFTLPPPNQVYSPDSASPRVSSIGSSASSNGDSHSSFTSAASSAGPKTPPSTGLAVPTGIQPSPSHPAAPYDQYSEMNHGPSEMYYQSHMSTAPAPPNQTVASSNMPYYSHQPSLLHTGSGQYPPPTTHTGQYGYANGNMASPQGGPLPGMGAGSAGLPLPPPGPSNMQQQYAGFDTSGQVAPPNMKPRVTATLWEDEGSLCFQVEARGICVARREGMRSCQFVASPMGARN